MPAHRTRRCHSLQNQFGGAVGGAVIKNRTFVFGRYEGFPAAQGNAVFNTTVPTLQERQGDSPTCASRDSTALGFAMMGAVLSIRSTIRLQRLR